MEETFKSVKGAPFALAEASMDVQLRPRGGEDQEEGGSTLNRVLLCRRAGGRQTSGSCCLYEH